ncbi:MAG: HIT family protein [Acidimicrobiia bacterium]
MTLERLWAGWRAAYIEGVTAQPDPAGECLFCTLGALDDAEALIVARGVHAFAVLNAFPYTSGHLMVTPCRHEADLDGLAVEEASEVMALTQQATTALKTAYRPDGLNVGINLGRAAGAGITGHVHVHALARWNGDTNFMTSVAEARVIPEDLRATWEKLRGAWPRHP